VIDLFKGFKVDIVRIPRGPEYCDFNVTFESPLLAHEAMMKHNYTRVNGVPVRLQLLPTEQFTQ
jgi:hypothetical protein